MGYILDSIFCVWVLIVIIKGIFRLNESDFKEGVLCCIGE